MKAIYGRNYGILKGYITKIELVKTKKDTHFLKIKLDTGDYGTMDVLMFHSSLNDVYSIAKIYKNGDMVSITGGYSISEYSNKQGKKVSSINFTGRNIKKISHGNMLSDFSFDGIVGKVVYSDKDVKINLIVDNSYIDKNKQLVERNKDVFSLIISEELMNVKNIEEGDFISVQGERYNKREFDEKWGKYTNNYIQKMQIVDARMIKKSFDLNNDEEDNVKGSVFDEITRSTAVSNKAENTKMEDDVIEFTAIEDNVMADIPF